MTSLSVIRYAYPTVPEIPINYLCISAHVLLNPLKHSDYYFQIQELRILPTQCICVFHKVLRMNSDNFPKKH
jgi:hypothetical protein